MAYNRCDVSRTTKYHGVKLGYIEKGSLYKKKKNAQCYVSYFNNFEENKPLREQAFTNISLSHHSQLRLGFRQLSRHHISSDQRSLLGLLLEWLLLLLLLLMLLLMLLSKHSLSLSMVLSAKRG